MKDEVRFVYIYAYASGAAAHTYVVRSKVAQDARGARARARPISERLNR
jgi:hypothetical protein